MNVDFNWLQNFLPAIKDIILPITSLVFSSFAFYFSLIDKRARKTNVDIEFISETREWLIDRDSLNQPDKYHQHKYRLFLDTVITNNSSLPITFISVELKNPEKSKINSTTTFSNKYKVSLKDPSNTKEWLEALSKDHDISRTIDLSEEGIIKFPFTLKPYESAVTFLVFAYDKQLPALNTIYLRTSRGQLSYKISVDERQESSLDEFEK